MSGTQITAAQRLANLEAAIDAFVANGMLREYEAGGITFKRESFANMLMYRKELRQQVAASKIRGRQIADLSGGR